MKALAAARKTRPTPEPCPPPPAPEPWRTSARSGSTPSPPRPGQRAGVSQLVTARWIWTLRIRKGHWHLSSDQIRHRKRSASLGRQRCECRLRKPQRPRQCRKVLRPRVTKARIATRFYILALPTEQASPKSSSSAPPNQEALPNLQSRHLPASTCRKSGPRPSPRRTPEPLMYLGPSTFRRFQARFHASGQWFQPSRYREPGRFDICSSC
jgi:hypothetical protein